MTLAQPFEQYTASARRFLNALPQSGRAQVRLSGIGCSQWGHSSVVRFTSARYHGDTFRAG